MATVLAELTVTVICFVNIGRFYDRRAIFAKYYQYWLAAVIILVVAAIGGYLPLGRWVSMCVVIVFSVAGYFSVLLLLKNPYFLEARDIVMKKLKLPGHKGRIE